MTNVEPAASGPLTTRLRQLFCSHAGTETTEETTDNGRVVTVRTHTVCLRCGKGLRRRSFFTAAARP